MEQKRRPFNDALAQRTIDMQVKEIDRLYQHLGEAMGRIETDGKLIATLEAALVEACEHIVTMNREWAEATDLKRDRG